MLPACVLWDTPDFDSIHADQYREGMLRTLALADVLVLVVSKEKYADLSVWQMLELLAPLAQPTLICLNKLKPGTEDLLLASVAEKWRNLNGRDPDALVPIHYAPDHQPRWPGSQVETVQQLAHAARRQIRANAAEDFINSHWDGWLTPVREEMDQVNHWRQLIDSAIEEAMGRYQKRFLDHPQHYETFQNAIAALSVLLEIPGAAKFLMHTRRVLTFPLRQVFSLGKSKPPKTQELPILHGLAEHFVTELTECLVGCQEQRSHPMWRVLIRMLRQEKQALLTEFNAETARYHTEFQSEIDQSARQLYEHLQEHPVLLNGLRATRLTTDAAAVAITLHAGGIGVHDLLIAPAMLSFTSYLTESALGGQVHRVEAKLKVKQREVVEQRLFGMLRMRLRSLTESLPDKEFFKIRPEDLVAAEQMLPSKKHGLRIL